MRLRIPLTLVALMVLACVSARAQEEQGRKPDEQVIDDFVTSRGVIFEEPVVKKAGPKRVSNPAPSRRNGSAGKGTASGDSVASGKKTGGKSVLDIKSGKGESEAAGLSSQAAGGGGDGAEFVNAGGALRPLALGYTILMKDDTGRLFVADPAREFKTGDRFAVALETNADGYLYLFSAENGRDPELLFPNAQIDGGTNAVQAHARATFPTGPAADVEYFIDVTDPPAAEHLFIVFSRRPLQEVPAGEALVKFCGRNLEDCAWKPTPAQWARIAGGAKGRGVIEAKSMQLAQASAPAALPATLQRGLKVKKDDPRPAIVRVNDSPDADLLVTEIVLTHK